MDELVEFREYIGGSEGSIFYNKRPGFGATMAWKANVKRDIAMAELDTVRSELERLGIRVAVSLEPDAELCGNAWHPSLRMGPEGADNLSGWPYFIDGILNDTDHPESWKTFGPLPTGRDGYASVRIIAAILESAERDEVVDV